MVPVLKSPYEKGNAVTRPIGIIVLLPYMSFERCRLSLCLRHVRQNSHWSVGLAHLLDQAPQFVKVVINFDPRPRAGTPDENDAVAFVHLARDHGIALARIHPVISILTPF